MADYLFHNATSPKHPRLMGAILPLMRKSPAPASSLRGLGALTRPVVTLATLEMEPLHHYVDVGREKLSAGIFRAEV